MLPEMSDNWGLLKKIAFRFFFVFYLLALFPFPFTQFPSFNFLISGYEKLWEAIAQWVGINAFGISYKFPNQPNGSGDRIFDYTFLFIITSVAIVSCLVWSVIDRKRNNYSNLYKWSVLYARFFLVVAMLEYGFAKIFLTQFPPLTPSQLLQTYGQSSPMGLLWTFMSYSKGYNIFIGIAEVIAGALLLYRRTVVLGLLITIAIMGNVVALNFYYDVPVKIFSVELLVLALLLVAKNAKRLINLFILNKPVEPEEIETYFVNSKMKYAGWGITFLFISYVLYSNISNQYAAQKEYAKRSFLYGVYNVESFVMNNDTLPPVVSDSIRWDNVIIEEASLAELRMMNEQRDSYLFKADTVTKTISLSAIDDSTLISLLHFNLPDSNHLVLNGRFKNTSVNVMMKKVDLRTFPLTRRGFHWINESPVNY